MEPQLGLFVAPSTMALVGKASRAYLSAMLHRLILSACLLLAATFGLAGPLGACAIAHAAPAAAEAPPCPFHPAPAPAQEDGKAKPTGQFVKAACCCPAPVAPAAVNAAPAPSFLAQTISAPRTVAFASHAPERAKKPPKTA
jgi:hypothetical protein